MAKIYGHVTGDEGGNPHPEPPANGRPNFSPHNGLLGLASETRQKSMFVTASSLRTRRIALGTVSEVFLNRWNPLYT